MDIVGHTAAVRRLESAIANGNLPNALIISGPEGVGKARLAREIARTLNCVGENPPCGHCVHCRQIAGGIHPDVVSIARREGKTAISIEQVRELREEASLRPYQGRFKVYIVDGAETLTPAAADALLKTLEEPPADLILILTALDEAALPLTVVSRCRVSALSALSTSEVAAGLRAAGAGDEAGELARLAQGNLGWALRARDKPKLRAEREALLEQLEALPGLGLGERLDLAEKLAADKKDRAAPRAALEVLLLIMRERMLQRISGGEMPDMASFAAIRRAMERLDRNVDPRLTLEALFIGLS